MNQGQTRVQKNTDPGEHPNADGLVGVRISSERTPEKRAGNPAERESGWLVKRESQFQSHVHLGFLPQLKKRERGRWLARLY